MNISILQASKDWKVSRTTIYKKIENGDMSRNEDKTVNVTEMIRVFGEPKGVEQHEQYKDSTQSTTLNMDIEHEKTQLKHQLNILEIEKKSLQNEVNMYKQRVEFLESELSKSTDSIKELSQVKLLLEHKQELEPVTVAKQKKWWSF